MIVRGHLRDRQDVRLLADLRSRSMECSANITRTLTDNTEDATCRIREIELRCGSTELDSNHVVKERVLRLQKRSAVAFQPTKLVLSYKRHFDVARNGLLVRAERGGTTEDRSHGSTRIDIFIDGALNRCHG